MLRLNKKGESNQSLKVQQVNSNSNIALEQKNQNDFQELNNNFFRYNLTTAKYDTIIIEETPFCTKSKIIKTSIVGGAIAGLLTLFLIFHFAVFKISFDIIFEIPNYNGDVIINFGGVSSIVKIKVYYLKDYWYTKENIKELETYNNTKINFIDAAPDEGIKDNYLKLNLEQGRYTFKIVGKSGWNTKTIYKQVSVIRNEEIIISALASTMPVTVVTLQLKELTKNYSIPMFVILEKRKTWNYDNMPNNIYLIHTYNESDFNEYSIELDVLYDRVKEWILMLNEWYPNLKYTFYLSDEFSFGHMQLIYLTNLNISNFKMYFITSGVKSSRSFNDIYDNTNWEDNYEKYKNIYNQAIEEIRVTKSYNYETNPYKMNSGFHFIIVILLEYPNINYYWIVHNHKLLGTGDSKNENGIYKTKIEGLFNASKIIDVSVGNILKTKSEDDLNVIRNLYHFSLDVFSDAINQNKDAVIFLGRRTEIEYIIDTYIKMTILFYGNDKYSYYYKGHPNDNTVIEDKKNRFSTNLNVSWIDASIPAELLYYLGNNQEVNGRVLHTHFAGYSSGTFESIPANYSLCGWEMVYEFESNYSSKVYLDNLDFVSFASDSTNKSYGQISENATVDGDPQCFVLRYVKKKFNYSHSVFYFNNSTFRHFIQLGTNNFKEYKE